MENDETIIDLKVAVAVLATKVDSLATAVSKLEKRLEKNDSEHNFNFLEWIKNNFLILITAGVVIAHTFGLI